MLRNFLLCFVIAVAAVQAQTFSDTLPAQTVALSTADPMCGQTEFTTAPWTMFTSTIYTANFSNPKGLCYLSKFISPCATLGGVTACNNYNQQCTSINSSIDITSTTLHPEIVAATTQRPSVCVSAGAFFHPDAIVFVIVLIIIGWLMLVALFVYVIVAFRALRPGAFLNVMLIFSFVLCTLLLFSYYYLNAVLVLGCVYVAYMLFSVRRSDCTAFGFLILLGGMLWTMHASALGWVQHSSRFTSATSDSNAASCVNYYRGYFAVPAALMGDFDNPLINSDRFCRREWLGAELFFMILLQLVLLLSVVAGAASRTSAAPVKQVKAENVE